MRARSVTTRNVYAWTLLAVGAHVAAWTSCVSSSGSTGSGRRRRIARIVLITSRIGASAPNEVSSELVVFTAVTIPPNRAADRVHRASAGYNLQLDDGPWLANLLPRAR